MKIFLEKKELSRNEKLAFLIGQIWTLKDWTDLLYFDHGQIEKRIGKLFDSEGIVTPDYNSSLDHAEKSLRLLRDTIKLKRK